MKNFVAAGLMLALSLGASGAWAQEVPEFPPPAQEHQWLQQLVGEWETECEMFPKPSEPPVKSRGTETVRAIGGFWVLAENHGEALGQPFTGVLTLGYDAAARTYVGTWIDSMTGHLWTYQGTVDATGKTLTLETTGPCPASPETEMKFKEVLEIRSPDHKVFTSSVQGDDGAWTTILTIHYRRKK